MMLLQIINFTDYHEQLFYVINSTNDKAKYKASDGWFDYPNCYTNCKVSMSDFRLQLLF